MRVLVLVFVTMVGAGVVVVRSQWGKGSEPTVFYEKAGKSLPVLRALAREHVTFLRVQDWCRAYADDRERRTNQLMGTCTLKDGFQLFDEASEKRYAELHSELDALPYDVNWLKLEYGPRGELRTAELAVDTINPLKRDSLIYDPGYTLPEDIPGEIVNHRIDADWYYCWEDWN